MTPTKIQIANGTYKLVEGRWHKKCTGPAHAEEPDGLVWLPATQKYFFQNKTGKQVGQLSSRCRLCTNWDKLKSPGSHQGYVEVEKIRPLYFEAINRIGIMELSKRAGVSRGHIKHVLFRETKHVQKAKVRKVLLELTSLKRKTEEGQSYQLRVWNDKRNNGVLGNCPGCGGPFRNMTADCHSCRDRHYDKMRRGQITKEEYEILMNERVR